LWLTMLLGLLLVWASRGHRWGSAPAAT